MTSSSSFGTNSKLYRALTYDFIIHSPSLPPAQLDLHPVNWSPNPSIGLSFVFSRTHSSTLPTMLRTSLLRAGAAPRASIVRSVPAVQQRQAHAISNPTLANIEKRWEGMPPQEQADLWMALRDRMKANWAELTLQEKKAGM